MRPRAPRRRTKIVCTIGPATASAEAILRLAETGMDVARLNFSYGDHELYGQVIGRVRAASAHLEKPIAILQDLAGPKLRVGAIPSGEVLLKPGDEVVLSAAPSPSPGAIPLPAPELPRALTPRQRLLLNDGRIELRVISTADFEIRCQVVLGGTLRSHQGLVAPEAALPIRAVTEKDLADLEFGAKHRVDWVAMSFVRDASDIEPVRDRMGELGLVAGLMAKIEKHEALTHLDDIIAQSDAIMVARGDLGIEVPLPRVPIIQKDVIRRCNEAGKPVVIATQMLESMISSPRPTRAEVSDIANAVLDGADAVMLSGETAAGSYPSEAVDVMARVAVQAEAAFDYGERLARSAEWPSETISDAIAEATCGLAQDLGARAIITPTSTGHTPMMVAMHRPAVPIVAITEHEATQRRLALVWGVYPLLAPRGRNTDEVMRSALSKAQEGGFVESGDRVIVTAGVPSGIPGRTNVIKVEVVGYHEGVEGAGRG